MLAAQHAKGLLQLAPLHDIGKKVRKEAYTDRAKADLARWISETREAVPA